MSSKSRARRAWCDSPTNPALHHAVSNGDASDSVHPRASRPDKLAYRNSDRWTPVTVTRDTKQREGGRGKGVAPAHFAFTSTYPRPTAKFRISLASSCFPSDSASRTISPNSAV